jgi:hypothetical protein
VSKIRPTNIPLYPTKISETTFGTGGARLDWLLCARAEWRRRRRLYLRLSVRRKNGRSHTYWRLVHSVRCGGKVVAARMPGRPRQVCRRPPAAADYKSFAPK